MKIVFVLNAIVTGGAEKHAIALAEDMIARNADCVMFAMRRGDFAPEGLVLHQPRAHETFSLPRRISALATLLRAEKPDLILCVNDRPLAVASIARRLARSPAKIVAIEHSSVFRTRKEALMDVLYRPFHNRADCLVYISGNQRRLWASRGVDPKTSVTILNGVDLSYFSLDARRRHRDETRRQLGLEDGDFVVGCCAVLRPEKNHAQLLEAIELVGSRLSAKALIVGDGPMREALEASARAAGVHDRVLFIGHQSDVRPYLAAFDVAVLCSVAIETLSLAALEALAMGVPVLMSDIGGASEIVDGRNGATFPVGDTPRLAELMERFRRLGREPESQALARASAERNFCHIRMTADYWRLFDSMVSETG